MTDLMPIMVAPFGVKTNSVQSRPEPAKRKPCRNLFGSPKPGSVDKLCEEEERKRLLYVSNRYNIDISSSGQHSRLDIYASCIPSGPRGVKASYRVRKTINKGNSIVPKCNNNNNNNNKNNNNNTISNSHRSENDLTEKLLVTKEEENASELEAAVTTK